ncbi:MAG: SusD/RagB family nutrient-binding outer membrane lipoprotein [Tannerella sp.]|jgi:hypothetical protein|nr:SusD/RagB family nutrient-binding outer membrane lipoprotein [Tannerella sp.]
MKKIATIFIIAAGLFSCTGNFEEINTNPNVATNVSAYGMFEPLLYDGGKDWQNYTWFWNDELIQFTAFTGGTTREEHRYIISVGNWASVWNLYMRRANDAQHMYELAVEQNDPALQAIALTFKVYIMSNLTDWFGDIPYAEAFMGAKPGGTITPVFDSQKDVYLLMFADLEKANDLYGMTPAPVFLQVSMDGMYGGQMKGWQKFNNSLYMRLLCRVSGRSEMNAGAKMTEIIGNPEKYPIFESNADNATIHYAGTTPYVNYFYNTPHGEFTGSGRKITEQVIKMTLREDELGNQTVVDPRLPVIAQPATAGGRWKGTISGVPRQYAGDANSGSSQLNTPVFCRPTAPTFIMDFAELQFILAEAALKGYISGGEARAQEYYTAAVIASLEKWAEFGQYSETPVTIGPLETGAFLESEFASWELAENKEQLIADQKYLALFWVGMEAYHEYRRTGYPVLTIGAGTVANDYILPTRFGYNNVTMGTNPNATIAVNRMGGNDMKTPVWWSKQAIESGR